MSDRSKQKTVYIMLKEDTKRLLRMIGAKRQFETHESVSDDDALYAFIQKHEPDLIKTLEEQKTRIPEGQ